MSNSVLVMQTASFIRSILLEKSYCSITISYICKHNLIFVNKTYTLSVVVHATNMAF